ncbi:MAG: NAD-dependent epimerase/dehydratase family protein [Thermoprotei archaeon]
MKVLVTNASSDLGLSLIQSLTKSGSEVYAVDERPLLLDKTITFIQEDIMNLHHVDSRIDQIYHISFNLDENHPVESALKNSVGTLNVLRIANVKRARIVLVTDPSVYQMYEIPSEANKASIEKSVLFAEALTAAYYKEKGVDARIARACDVYGPTQGIVTDLAKLSMKDLEIQVDNEDAYPCYVEDASTAIIKLMQSENQGVKARPIDICGYKIDKEGIAKLAKKMLNSQSKITVVKRDKRAYKPNAELARELLKWEPRYEIKEGLEMIIKSLKAGGNND